MDEAATEVSCMKLKWHMTSNCRTDYGRGGDDRYGGGGGGRYGDRGGGRGW